MVVVINNESKATISATSLKNKLVRAVSWLGSKIKPKIEKAESPGYYSSPEYERQLAAKIAKERIERIKNSVYRQL